MFWHRETERRPRARGGVRQAEQRPNERRLAGSVGPEIPEGAASRNEEFDVIDRHVLPEPFGQSMGLDGPRRRPVDMVARDTRDTRRRPDWSVA